MIGRLMQVRMALAAIGLVVWSYGLLRDEPRVRLVGIIVLALSLLLRFVPRRREPGSDGTA